MMFSLPQDESREIWYANRLVALLHGREPFEVWASQFRQAGEPEEELRAALDRPVPFLIPLPESEEENWTWLQENYLTLFETALWSWTPDQGRWPEDRSWDAFNEWFDLELLDAPWDVVAAPLHSNPPPADPSDWD
jgi:hypothetical protein